MSTSDDRAELASLRAELDRLREQLGRAQRLESLGLLAAGIVHDFNNLLTPIAGYAQLAQEELGDPEAPAWRWLDEIRDAAAVAAELTGQLLAFGKPRSSSGTVVLDVEIGRFAPFVRRLLRDAIEVELDLDAAAVEVDADAVQLGQLLMNLAINAQDAMPAGGKLAITTAHTPGAAVVTISVRDSGVGMDDATRQRVFDTYFTTKAPGEGSGLGLAIVRAIADRSGGAVRIESSPGAGTTIEVELPVASTASVVELAGPALAVHGVVLVVDGDAERRDHTAETLRATGCEVLTAADAEAALRVDRGRSGPLHVLLTRRDLPHAGGPALLERLCARHGGLRHLCLDDRTRGTGAGEPASPGDELIDRIRRAVH